MRSPTSSRWPRPLVVALALTLAGATVAGCSDDGSGPAAGGPATVTTAAPSPVEATEVSDEADLYAAPDELPDAPHGTLLKYQQIDPAPFEGATTWRILYLSESLAGEPIAVSGTAIVPRTSAPAEGRRLLSLAHGTTGIADECAPSKQPGSELFLMSPAIEAGWLVAMSDFEGLGTPGRHPYLVGQSEGRGVLDAITAAGQLPEADPGAQLAIAGYSQGGHGALWANQIAADWTPDLHVVGTFAGAPATELDVILAAAPRLPVAGFAYMIIAGFNAAYADADPAKILTPAGVERLDEVDQGCTRDVIAAFADADPSDLIRGDGPGSEPWKGLALANNPGQVRTDDPILIIHSDDDQVVPLALSGILLGRMCSNDQVVERRVLNDAGGHVGAATAAYASGLEWLTERFDASSEPVDSCPT